METKDLMLYDWVQVPSELNRFKQIKSTFDMNEAVLYQPIPLTAEILEKNGLKQGEFHKMQSFSVVVHDCSVLKMGNLLEIFQGGTYAIRLFVKYVYELQHALRLCGIDKEIEL